MKYIDVEKLKERIAKLEADSCISEYKDGFDDGVGCVLDIIDSLQQEQPSLPSNLGEAALQWWDSVKFYSDLSGTPINAFKAGAKWMAEQGISCEAEAVKDVGISFLKEPFEKATKEFDGKVIVQIRKKEE